MPYRNLRCFTLGSQLEWLYTRYSGSGDYKLSLYIRVAVQNMNSTLQLVYPCVWLLGC